MIVRGLRHRRWASLVVGVLLLAFCASAHNNPIGCVRRANWVRYCPFGKVLRDAKAGRLNTLDELQRRAHEGMLSESQMRAVVEAALEKDKQTLDSSIAHRWCEVIKALEQTAAATHEQREQIFPRFAMPSMRVRPVIRQGDPLVVKIEYQSARSSIFSGYDFWEEPVGVRVGGHAVYVSDGQGWRKRQSDWFRDDFHPVLNKIMQFEADTLPSGRWTVEYTGRRVFLHSRLNRAKDSPSWSGDVQSIGQVEILPADAPDPIVWVHDPKVTSQIEESVYVWLFDENDEGQVMVARHENDHVSLHFIIKLRAPTEIAVALQVVLQVGNRELRTEVRSHWWNYRGVRPADSALVWGPGDVAWAYIHATVPPFDYNRMTVILRASRDAACRTVDVYEVWEGELRYGPFTVEHVNPEANGGVDAP